MTNKNQDKKINTLGQLETPALIPPASGPPPSAGGSYFNCNMIQVIDKNGIRVLNRDTGYPVLFMAGVTGTIEDVEGDNVIVRFGEREYIVEPEELKSLVLI